MSPSTNPKCDQVPQTSLMQLDLFPSHFQPISDTMPTKKGDDIMGAYTRFATTHRPALPAVVPPRPMKARNTPGARATQRHTAPHGATHPSAPAQIEPTASNCRYNLRELSHSRRARRRCPAFPSQPPPPFAPSQHWL